MNPARLRGLHEFANWALKLRRFAVKTWRTSGRITATLLFRKSSSPSQTINDREFYPFGIDTVGGDHAYDAQLDAVKTSLREATKAVRAQAEDTRKRIDQVLADADKIVGSLEADETKAAEQKS